MSFCPLSKVLLSMLLLSLIQSAGIVSQWPIANCCLYGCPPVLKKKSGLNSTESRLCVFMFILIKQHILGSVRSHFRSLTCDLLHSISKRERERLPDSWIGALGELLQTFHSPWALKIITCNRWSRWAALLLHPVTWERIPCKTIFSSCKHQILIEK